MAFCFWMNCPSFDAAFETMRQPLEEGHVTINAPRADSEFMLVAAMNPTPDGKMPMKAAVARVKSRIISGAFPARARPY